MFSHGAHGVNTDRNERYAVQNVIFADSGSQADDLSNTKEEVLSSTIEELDGKIPSAQSPCTHSTLASTM